MQPKSQPTVVQPDDDDSREPRPSVPGAPRRGPWTPLDSARKRASVAAIVEQSVAVASTDPANPFNIAAEPTDGSEPLSEWRTR